MKLVYDDFDFVIDTDIDLINTIVIENTKCFYEYVASLYNQIQGLVGKIVVSNNNKPLDVGKNIELIINPFEIDINKKSLMNKVIASISKQAVIGENYAPTAELMAEIEKRIYDLLLEMDGDFEFDSLLFENIIRAIGIKHREDYTSLTEKILDYMELVREYDHNKLFVLVNFRSYVDKQELGLFFDSIIGHNYHVLLVDNISGDLLECEKRYIIDKDLCVIC